MVGIDAPRLRAEAVRDALDAAPGDDVLLADDDRATLTAVVDAAQPPGDRQRGRAGHRSRAAALLRPGDGRGDRARRHAAATEHALA